jgi:hypothetical protein
LGDHWTLDYTPAIRFYSSSQFQNEVDQIVNLACFTTWQDWSLSFSQGYSATSQPLVETAGLLNQEVYATSLRVGHSIGGSFSLDLGVAQNFRYVDENQPLGFAPTTRTLEWSTLDWVNYQFAPRLNAGIGGGFTFDDVTPPPNQVSEQLQGRINWVATDKLTFMVSGGVDYRQFVDSPAPNLLSPIFSGSVQYHLFENTTLSVIASSSVSPGYYQNSLSQADTVSITLHQRLLKHLSLDVSGGYTSTSYQQTSSTVNTVSANNYDTTSYNIRLSTVLFKGLMAAVYFQENFISNSQGSTANLYNYNTRQAGLSLAYHF